MALARGWRAPCIRCKVDRHDRCIGPYDCGCEDPSHQPDSPAETGSGDPEPLSGPISEAQLGWTADMIRMIADQDLRLAAFDQWMAWGIERGWCSFDVCSTHDLVPLTPAEEAEFEDGADPCIHVVRLFHEGQAEEVAGRGSTPVPLSLAAVAEEEEGPGSGPSS